MSAEEFAGLGFAPGSVKGVRSFNVDKFGRLTGIHYSQVWLPGENEAECRKGENESFSIGGVVNSSIARMVYDYTYGNSGGYSGLSLPVSYIPVSSPTVSRKHGKKNVTMVPVQKALPPATAPVPEKTPHNMEECSCGFYGYFDGSDDYHDHARITAVVEAYGETIIGTRGFRAMKARILALRIHANDDGITESVARKLTVNYRGIPTFETFEEMVAAFPPDVSLEPSPDSDPDFWTRK